MNTPRHYILTHVLAVYSGLHLERGNERQRRGYDEGVRTSHIQNASILFLGGGSSYLFLRW